MSTQIQITPETGITIGTTPISSGTDGRILFQSGGVVSQSPNLTYNGSLFVLDGNSATANSSIFEVKGGGGQRSFRAYQDNSAQVGGNTNNFQTKGTGTGQVTNNFYSADSHWCFGGAAGYGRVHIGALSNNPQAVLDVRAQGALSTDIAFRVRNSANTANIVESRGDGLFYIENQNFATALYVRSSLDVLTVGTGLNYTRQNASGNLTFTLKNGASNTSDIKLIAGPGGTVYWEGLLSHTPSNKNITFFAATNIVSGNSGNSVIWVRSGTSAPTTSNADMFGMYSADIVAGNAAPHFRTEDGSVIKLYQQSSAGITTVADIVTVLQNLGFLS